jgi:hypothetical protein
MASSCWSLSLSFSIIPASDYLIWNGVMFGINRRIGE